MPLAYWCVLIAALMPIALAAYAKAGSGGDNHNPRDTVASLTEPVFGAALLYTVVHFVAFALFGVLLVRLVHIATSNSVVRFGLLVVFLVFEVFFYGIVAALTGATSRLFPFWAVLTANLLASVAMGVYLWRTHPAFREAVQSHPLGVPDGN